MAELDNLTIKIQGDTSDATVAIQGLIDKLDGLQNKLNGISNRKFNESMTAAGTALSSLKAAANETNTNGIDKIASWLTNLSTALSGFDAEKFKSVNDALTTLMSFKSSDLPNLKDIGAGAGLLGEGAEGSADAILKISTGIKSLSEVVVPDGLADSIAGLADSLTKISEVKAPNFDGIEHFTEMCKTLEKSLPNSKVGADTQGWANLFNYMSQLKFSKIGPEINAAKSAIEGLSSLSVPNFSNFKVLADALQTMQTALTAFPQAVSGAIKQSENLKRISVPKGFADDMARVSNAIKSFTLTPGALDSAVQLAGGLEEAGSKIKGAADAFERITPSIEKISQVVIPAEIANQLMEIATALEQLTSISPEKIGNIKNQMQALGSTGKSVQNAANSVKNASKNLGKGKNGFVDSFMDGAESMGFMDRASISLGAQLGTVTSVASFTTSMFKKLAGTVVSFGNVMKNSSNITKGFSNKLKSIYYTLGTIRRVVYAVRAAFNAIKVPVDLASDLTEVQNVVLQAFGPQNFQNIDKWSKSLVTSFGISSKTAKEAAARYGAMAVSMGFSQKQATEMAQTMVERSADIGSLYNKDFATVAKNMDSVFTGMVAPMRKYGVDLTQASLKEYAMQKGLNANIKGMTQMQKAMLRYEYVLEKTSIAQGDFARTSGTWANQLKILKTYLEALGSTIGQVFINLFKPVIRSVNNAMNAIIGLVERTVNAIGKMMGWQIEIAPTFTDLDEMETDMADAAEEAAGGLENANDKAKELKRTILGFDEIHALSRPSDSSDSGKSGSGDSADDQADAAENIVKGGEMLLKRYESDIKDWFDLGSRIGETLAKALESINWDDVYKGARGFGTNLASFLNGLITPRLFDDVGKTVAGALNTALHFLDSFGMTFNWKNFGRSLAAGINGFFSTFDWGLLAHTINTWANGLLTTIIEFLGRVDWKQIVRGFNKFIGNLDFTGQFGDLGKSIKNALVDVMRTIDWNTIYSQAKNFASGLADFLNSLITPELFEEVGSTIGGVLTTVFSYLNTFWDEFDWHGFGVSLGRGISKFFQEFDLTQFASYIGKWVSSLFTVISTALLNADLSAIAKSVTLVIVSIGGHKAIAIAFAELAKRFNDVFKAKIIAAVTPSNWASAIEAFKNIGVKFGHAIEIGFETGDYVGAFTKSFGGVAGAIGAIVLRIVGFIGGIATAASGFFDMWNEGWSLASEVVKDIGIAIAGVAAVATGLISGPLALVVGAVVAAVSSIAAIVHEKIAGNAKQDFLDFVASTEGAGHTLEDFQQAMDDATTAATADLDEMTDRFKKLDSVRDEIDQTTTKMSTIISAMQSTKTATETEVDDLMTSFSNLQSSLQDYIDAYYDAMIEQMIMDMNYLDSQGKLTDSMKEEYLSRITEAYKAKDAAVESTNEIIANVQTAQQEYSDAVEQHGRDSQEAQDALSDLVTAYGNVTTAADQYAGTSNDKLSPAVQNATEDLEKLAGGLDLSKEGMKDAKDLTHKYTDTVRDMQDRVDKAKETIHEYYQKLRDDLDETEMTQDDYNFKMEEYNSAEQARIQEIEDKYGELKRQLDSEVAPAFDTMHITMSDDLDKMDRDADSKLSKLFSTFGGWIQNIKDKWNELRGMSVDANVNMSTNTSTGTSVGRYASGGIIEDGLFTMNHGEIAGKFNNGQSVVANNEQIQNGIRDAVVDGMMEVYMATSSDTDNSNGDLVLVVGDEEIARASMRGQRKLDKRFNPTIAFG